ncbi:hypothetical protein [Hungatella hathewayi]|uniref:hypothetical protein n=1 Tax=Hungatella hathewayi TaxID=154046 RepID=UPI003567184A
MFTSAKDITKIVWNGLKEIKKNSAEYCEKDAGRIYKETLSIVKTELSGLEPEEKRKECIVKNRWEKMRIDRKIVVISILTFVLSMILTVFYDKWIDFELFLLIMVTMAVLSVWRISHLFQKRFRLNLEGWLLEVKE